MDFFARGKLELELLTGVPSINARNGTRRSSPLVCNSASDPRFLDIGYERQVFACIAALSELE